MLLPAAAYGHNYTTMQSDELTELIRRAGERAGIDSENISLCGWSLGADAAAILTAQGSPLFARVCLISNYPKAWKGAVPVSEYRILVGAKEKSAARDWGAYSVERVPGYGHEIGEKVWLEKEVDLLGWLTKIEE